MPAVLKTPKSRWIETAAKALAEGGVDAVRIEALAATLKVSKGSFYAHFTHREELLEGVLDAWELRSTDDVLELLHEQGGNASERIRGAGALTFARDLISLDLAVRTWARRDSGVMDRLRRVDNARMNFLRDQFRSFISDPLEVESRSILAFALAIGSHFIAADLAGPSKTDAVAGASDLILRPHGGASGAHA